MQVDEVTFHGTSWRTLRNPKTHEVRNHQWVQTPLYETRPESFGVQIHVPLLVMVEVEERGGGLIVSQWNVAGDGGGVPRTSIFIGIISSTEEADETLGM